MALTANGTAFSTYVMADNTVAFYDPTLSVAMYSCATCVNGSSIEPVLATNTNPFTDPSSLFNLTVTSDPRQGSWIWNGTDYVWSWVYGSWGSLPLEPNPQLPSFNTNDFISLQVYTGENVTECSNCFGVSSSFVYQFGGSVQDNVFRVDFGSNYPSQVGFVDWNGSYLMPYLTFNDSGCGLTGTVPSPYYWAITVNATTNNFTLHDPKSGAYLGANSNCGSYTNSLSTSLFLTGSDEYAQLSSIAATSNPNTGIWTFDFWTQLWTWSWTYGSWGTPTPTPSSAPPPPSSASLAYHSGQFVTMQDYDGNFVGLCPTCADPTGLYAGAFVDPVTNYFQVQFLFNDKMILK